MAEPNPVPQSAESSAEAAAVHIVYTEKPAETEEPEAYHIRTLASVLGRLVTYLYILTHIKLMKISSAAGSVLKIFSIKKVYVSTIINLCSY